MGLACLNFFTIIKGLPAGTMLSVACGMLLYRNLNSETQLVRFLTLSPVRKIGLISFSLYLWHWPIVSFLKYVYIDGVPIGMLVLGIVLTFVLSYLSWRFVEEPFRKQKSNAAVLKFVISTAVITLIFGTFTISRDGFKSRHSELVNALSSAIQTNYRCPVSTYFAYGASRACLAGSATQVDYDIALLGNSHAQMYGHAFIKSLKKVGKRGVIVPLNGCIPTLDLNISSDCIGPARKNFEAVRDDPKINKIVIGLNWRLETLVNSEGETVSDISKRKRADALLKLISLLKQSGKDVYLMGPIATPDFRMASDLSRRLVFSDGQPQSEILEMMRFSKGSFDSEFGEVIQFLQKELGDKFLMPHEMLCDLEYCYFATELNIYFADSEHLSRQGSLLMVPLFDKIIDGS